MRTARIKISADEASALYHCTTRAVHGRWLFGDLAKETIRKLARVIAEACGVQLLTYAIMDNHLHLLVRVPRNRPIADEELLRRYCLRRPNPTQYDTAAFHVIRQNLAKNNDAGRAWRKAQLSLMGNISAYMKILKQKITTWYNRVHHTFGTLWASRFESVLIESDADLAEIVSVYIDLNPVRANLVNDPKDYRFCGYAEAVAGHPAAQQGIMHIVGETDWVRAQARYRLRLFATASAPRAGKHSISEAQVRWVAAKDGHLDLSTVLRCRSRYLTGSFVLGSQIFVATQLAHYRSRFGLKRKTRPPAVPILAGFHCLHPMRL